MSDEGMVKLTNNEGVFKLTVEFSTENSAFDVEDSWEIRRILRNIVDEKIYAQYETYGKVVDYNGNTIGRWYLGDDSTPVDDETTNE